MTYRQQVETALRQPLPSRILRELAVQWLSAGMTDVEAIRHLEDYLNDLRAIGDFPATEATEDSIIDVLDQLYGWCHPSVALNKGAFSPLPSR
jgi:hypothetical protein